MLKDARQASIFNGHDAALSFARAIVLGYEDGPSTGAVQRADGSAAYRFELIATDVDGLHDRDAWDRGEELRIFALSPLPHGSFEHIVSLLSAVESPHWPVWVPGARFSSRALDRIVQDQVVPILEIAGDPQLVMAAPGLLASPVAGRELSNGSGKPQQQDWFAYLGLEPSPVST
jgi:hypothetical protein